MMTARVRLAGVAASLSLLADALAAVARVAPDEVLPEWLDAVGGPCDELVAKMMPFLKRVERRWFADQASDSRAPSSSGN